jgi:hypothetical protein
MRPPRWIGIPILAAAWSCNDSSPTGPSAPLSETRETASIIFHYAPGDAVEAEREQAFHDWAVAELGPSLAGKMVYNKYLSRSHMGEHTGVYNTNGYAERNSLTLHTIWPFDNHEPVHLYTSGFGSPVALLSEGIAVSFQTDPAANDYLPKWNNERLHHAARRFRDSGLFVPLDRLLETQEFLQAPANVRYPEAGSFVLFLRESRGLARLKELFAMGNENDSRARLRESFQQVYGIPLESIEREWLSMLDAE